MKKLESIPRIIHYCWFGRGAKPAEAVEFIAGWKVIMPDYQFIEWSEENFDINICAYVEQAYASRRYAFVSDYARGLALYEYGGIYLDTDVKVLKSFDDLLQNRSFWGFEAGNFIATSTIGAIPKHEIIKKYLAQYHERKFLHADGAQDTTTNVEIITHLWQEEGLALNNELQSLGNGNLFLPQKYLSPYDYRNGSENVSIDTYAIHHYAKTWLSPWARVKGKAKRIINKIFGPRLIELMQRMRLFGQARKQKA